MTPWASPSIATLLTDQAGVVSRRQLLLAGSAPHDVKRLIRRRLLTPLHPGVYVDHTGKPSWTQEAWAGVLAVWPAALTHESALRAAEGPESRRDVRPVEVAVDRDRHVSGPPGLVVVRRGHLEERVQWHVSPPRMRYEEAVLDVALAANSESATLAELARATQGRRTTAARLRAALDGRARVVRRDLLLDVLTDLAGGTSSVLEREYRVRVEEPHGLTGARRQVRDRVGSGVIYRDVEYGEPWVGALLVVELDGRLHDTAEARDRDMERDLDTALMGVTTVRLSYRAVLSRPCVIAEKVARLLRHEGWTGQARPCGTRCGVPSGTAPAA
jgi:hypothetical protein